jgi:hypothetical protein
MGDNDKVYVEVPVCAFGFVLCAFVYACMLYLCIRCDCACVCVGQHVCAWRGHAPNHGTRVCNTHMLSQTYADLHCAHTRAHTNTPTHSHMVFHVSEILLNTYCDRDCDRDHDRDYDLQVMLDITSFSDELRSIGVDFADIQPFSKLHDLVKSACSERTLEDGVATA